MSDKKTDLSHGGLGDITKIMHNHGVSDLSWLAVDEDLYRAAESLPKQNLDTIPELQKCLSMDDDNVPHFIPLKPHTIVNRNPVDSQQASPVDISAPIRNRVAKMVMSGVHGAEIGRRLQLEFSVPDIRLAGRDIEKVLSERGLLGNIYIDSNHFPRCAKDSKEQKFAKTAGKRSLYVLAKDDCVGCVHNYSGSCSALGSKPLVDEIPYGPKLAADVSGQLHQEKRPINLSLASKNASKDEWKRLIKSSFLQSPIQISEKPPATIQSYAKPVSPEVTSSDIASYLERISTPSSIDPLPSVEYLKYARRMMAGYNDTDALILSTDAKIRSLASEYGILGHSYLDMDALGGCRNTLIMIREKSMTPDFVLRRSASCTNCYDKKDGACASICSISSIVTSKPKLVLDNLANAVTRAVSNNRISSDIGTTLIRRFAKSDDIASVISKVNLFVPKVSTNSVNKYNGYKLSFHNSQISSEPNAATMNPEEVRRFISHLMNLGFSGKKLQAAILNRYSRSDLVQVPEIGRRLALDNGIQGSYFIDPTAYPDYGKGCNDGAKHFRKLGARNILASDGCTGCTLQTAPGWCSKYSKDIIRQVPDEVRSAAISARRSLPVVQSTHIENVVDKYELSSDLNIDISDPERKNLDLSISGYTVDM